MHRANHVLGVTRSRPGPRRAVAVVASGAIVIALLAAPAPTRAATPPPNPTNQQLNDAAAQKAALANQVGALGAEVAQEQNELGQLKDSQEAAEQLLAWRLSLLVEAKQNAQAAMGQVAVAQQQVVSAQQQFSAFAQASYMSGSIGGTTGSLLTASDPNVVLQQGALQSYEDDHQLDAIGQMRQATVAKSNADARARAAVQQENKAADAAQQAKDAADAAVVAAIAEQKQLQISLAANQKSLDAAQLELATLNNQRQVYLAYQAHQRQLAIARAKAKKLAEERARLEAIHLAKLAAAREAKIRAQELEARQRAEQQAAEQKAAEQKAAEAARRRSDDNSSDSSSSSDGSDTGSDGSSDGTDSGSDSTDTGSGSGTDSGSDGTDSGSNAPDSGSSSSSDGSSGSAGDTAPTPSGGAWTAAKGQAAVDRAMAYLGIMYAWAGGDSSGPTYGVCAGDGAYNDCHIKGFDCSGLALYAWAPYLSLVHYAKVQYGEAGSYHPSISDLMPGDLVFWSSDGTVSGIHHVAIYIGDGDVIQAPESGSVVQVTPVLQVDSGLFGATRPLT